MKFMTSHIDGFLLWIQYEAWLSHCRNLKSVLNSGETDEKDLTNFFLSLFFPSQWLVYLYKYASVEIVSVLLIDLFSWLEKGPLCIWTVRIHFCKGFFMVLVHSILYSSLGLVLFLQVI